MRCDICPAVFKRPVFFSWQSPNMNASVFVAQFGWKMHLQLSESALIARFAQDN